MYMNGSESYVEVLLNSNGLGDFVSRLENVMKIISYDQGVVTKLNSTKEQLNAEKTELEKQKSTLVALQTETQNKKDDLTAKKAEQAKVMEVAKANADLFKQAMAASQSQVDEAIKQIQASIQQSTNSS